MGSEFVKTINSMYNKYCISTVILCPMTSVYSLRILTCLEFHRPRGNSTLCFTVVCIQYNNSVCWNKLYYELGLGDILINYRYHDMSIHIVSQLNIVCFVIYQKFQLSSRNVQVAVGFLPLMNTSMKSLGNAAWCVDLIN